MALFDFDKSPKGSAVHYGPPSDHDNIKLLEIKHITDKQTENLHDRIPCINGEDQVYRASVC